VIEQDGATRLLESPGVRAWNLMTEIWKSVKPWAEKVATSFGLTPQQLISMKIMGEYGTMTMSELAQRLGCDASNVTSLVDKLETRGLVERRASEHDRRVKSLVMTRPGSRCISRRTNASISRRRRSGISPPKIRKRSMRFSSAPSNRSGLARSAL